jgi:hypothetical protein
VIARYERELIGSIVDRTAPVLLDRDEAQIGLDIGPGVFDRWVREGELDDWVCVGERQLFRRESVRKIILESRRRVAGPWGNSATLQDPQKPLLSADAPSQKASAGLGEGSLLSEIAEEPLAATQTRQASPTRGAGPSGAAP